jgi:hypothetical protein
LVLTPVDVVAFVAVVTVVVVVVVVADVVVAVVADVVVAVVDDVVDDVVELLLLLCPLAKLSNIQMMKRPRILKWIV